ncbi:MAG: hypothetical protein SFU85_08550 [Candidatus Methylacidiphilales bacterium]|nr:hypothetical protein [Candidatus Methylacidiphilales bacterium]
MNIQFKSLTLAAIVALASANGLTAQTVGYLTANVTAGSIATPSTTVFSITFNDELPSGFVGQGTGTLTGVTSNTITNSSAAWTSGFVTASTPYFVKLTSGSAVGRVFRVTSATSTTLTLTVGSLNLTTLGVTAGNTYQLFPAETLDTIFSTLAVSGNTTSATSDNVLLFNGTTWNSYWFNSSVSQWRLGAIPTNQGTTVVSPETGLIYLRRGATSMSILSSGVVPSTSIPTEISNGATTFLGSLYPVDTTLNNTNIHTTPGWVSGTSATGTDKVLIWNGSSWNSYWRHSTLNVWRLGAIPTAQNPTIVGGSPIIISKATPSAGSSTYTKALGY